MFGDRLKDLRKEKKVSQEELGKILNVSKMTISNWEANVTQPSVENINSISNYFGVTPNYLFGFIPDDFKKIENLKIALKEAGLMTNDDLTFVELEKALKIVELMREKTENDNLK